MRALVWRGPIGAAYLIALLAVVALISAIMVLVNEPYGRSLMGQTAGMVVVRSY